MSKKHIKLYVRFTTDLSVYWKLVPAGTKIERGVYIYSFDQNTDGRISSADEMISDCKDVLRAFKTNMVQDYRAPKSSFKNLSELFSKNIDKALSLNWDKQFNVVDFGHGTRIDIYYDIDDVEFEPRTFYLTEKQLGDISKVAQDVLDSISKPYVDNLDSKVMGALISAYKQVHKKDGEDM